MVAGFKRRYCNFGMAVVRCTYVYDVKSACGQQLTEIGIYCSAFSTVFTGSFLCAFFNNIAEGYHFSIFLTGQARHMFTVGDTSAPDNSNFVFNVRHELFPLD
ncbi:hypothetical protein D3C76_1665630 [compost metagenome]